MCSLALFFAFDLRAFAQTDIEQTVVDKFSETADDVAKETGSDLASELADGMTQTSADALVEALTPQRLWDEIKKAAADPISDGISLLKILLSLVLVCAVFNALCSSVGTGALAHGVEFLGSAAIVSAILAVQLGGIEEVADYFEDLGALMMSMIPVAGSVWAMGGNVSTAAAGSSALYAMTALTQGLCASSVMPVSCVMGVSAICSGLSDSTLLGGFCGAVKKIYNFFIGLLMTVFVFSLGAQTLITGAADTLAARGAKLLSSTLIPGVGGAVGDSLRTVAGSAAYVKSVVGIGGIVLICVLTLPPLISLVMSRLAFVIAKAAADMLGCKRESRLLDELGSIYGFLIGAVAVCAVAFVIAMAIFLRCTVAIA
jgi:stage III sporulation protein AE